MPREIRPKLPRSTPMRRSPASLHPDSLIAILCVLVPHVNAATPVYVNDWCNLDLPEHSGDYANVSTMLMPNQDAKSAMRNLLVGKTIRAVAHLDTGRVEHATFKSVDGCGDCPYPDVFYCAPWLPDRKCDEHGGLQGRDYEVMEAIANRGGFKVEWALTRGLSPTYNERFTPMAVNFTTDSRFDLTANWWTDTEERRKLGLVVGHHHTDASRVLMVKRSGEDEEIDYTLMIRPFSPSVWYALCSVLILHSVLMLFTEHPDWYNDEKLGKGRVTRFVKGSLSEMWISFERLNNGGNHHEEPETNNGRLLMSVYGLFSLLIVSLYTAKLAAIIVIQDSSAGSQIRSLEDLKERGGRAIMFNGEPMRNRMISAHPYLKITEAASLDELKTAKLSALMNAHNAHAVILPNVIARNAVRNHNNCDMLITNNVQISGGGFMASLRECTHKINLILDALLMEIENDGTLDVIERKFLNTDTCISGPNEGASNDDSSLRMEQMFALYAVIAGGMILVSANVFASGAKTTHAAMRQRSSKKKLEIITAPGELPPELPEFTTLTGAETRMDEATADIVIDSSGDVRSER